MKHTALVLFSSILSMLVAVPALAAPAANVGPDLVVRSQSNPNFCMDASLDKNEEGREVYIYKCTGRYNQRWTLTQGADGSSAMVGFDGRCADIRGRHVGDKTPIELWGCNYGANQQFELTAQGQLRERQSGKCLTLGEGVADRHPVYIDECDGNPKQRWTLRRGADHDGAM